MINVINATGIFKVKIKKYESPPDYWSGAMFKRYPGEIINVAPAEPGTHAYDNGFRFMIERESDRGGGTYWYFKPEDIDDQIPQWVSNLQNLFEVKL